METIENVIAEEIFTYIKDGEKPGILRMQIGEASKNEDDLFECPVIIITEKYTRRIRSSGLSSYDAVKNAIELLSINFFAYKKDGDLLIGDWNVETILPKDYWEHDHAPKDFPNNHMPSSVSP